MVDIPLIIFIAFRTIAHMLVSLMTTTNAVRTWEAGNISRLYTPCYEATEKMDARHSKKETCKISLTKERKGVYSVAWGGRG